MIYIVYILLFLLFLLIVGGVIILSGSSKSNIKNKYIPKKLKPFPQYNSSGSSKNQVSEKVIKDLLRLVNYDKSTMKRLIDQLKRQYPNKEEIWYYERAISDLERDRR